MKESRIIDTPEALNEVVQKALLTDAVALDTEFVWERTYYPQLGLVQIALSDEECYGIDPLAVGDLSPLGELLESPNTVKILHDAPQDLVILRRATGAAPYNIFDTQLAAGFAGFSATTSLFQLIKDQLDTEIDKSETRANWVARPLSEKQICYALNDVRYLRAIRVLLLGSTIGPRIKSWLQEELNNLNNPRNYAAIADDIRYKKIKGVSRLGKQQLGVAYAIANWREQKAREIDRPRNHVIRDEIIIELATTKPVTLECLAKTSISPKALERYGVELCQNIMSVLTNKESFFPQPQTRIQLTAHEKDSLQNLKELIQLKCEILNMDPSLIGNSNELNLLVKSIHTGTIGQLRQTIGWRKEFLKDFFSKHSYR